jgi:hypothetical protein
VQRMAERFGRLLERRGIVERETGPGCAHGANRISGSLRSCRMEASGIRGESRLPRPWGVALRQPGADPGTAFGPDRQLPGRVVGAERLPANAYGTISGARAHSSAHFTDRCKLDRITRDAP